MEPSRRHESAELLSERADLVRSRLARTLSALATRRRAAMDLPLQVTRHPGAVAVVVGACVTGIVVVAVYRARTAAARRRRARWMMLRTMWSHPERIAQPPEPTVVGKLARTLVVGLVRLLVTQLLNGETEPTSTPPAPARLHR